MAAQNTYFFAWSAHFRTRSPPKRDADSAKTRSETARFFLSRDSPGPATLRSLARCFFTIGRRFSLARSFFLARSFLLRACARHQSAPHAQLATSKLHRFSRAPLGSSYSVSVFAQVASFARHSHGNCSARFELSVFAEVTSFARVKIFARESLFLMY